MRMAAAFWPCGHMDILASLGGLRIDRLLEDLTLIRSAPQGCRDSVLDAVSVCLEPLLAARGSVVLTSSVNATTGIGEVAYSCAKAALHPLAMNLAVAYGPRGLNANAFASAPRTTASKRLAD